MFNITIGPLDFILLLAFIALVWIAHAMPSKNSINEEERALKVLFRKALLYKIFFSFLFCVIIVYLYGGVGDSISFFAESQEARHEVASGNLGFLEYLQFGEEDFMAQGWYQHGAPSGAFLEKISFLLSYPGCGSYLLTSALFAYFSFFGVWKLYTTFIKFFPDNKRLLQFGILFFPSVCFYSSGIFKDTISFSALGWFVYALYEISYGSSKKIKTWVVFFISGYLIYKVRSFVVYSLGLSILIMAYTNVLNVYAVGKTKYIFHFLFLSVSFALFFNFYEYLEEELLSSFLDEIISSKNLYDSIGGGSNYNLINAESFTLAALLKVLPLAIFTTLFRPFLWESNSLLMLISSLENAILFFYFVNVLVKNGFKKIYFNLSHNILLIFCIVFVLIFSGLVSIYTSNFGTLIRYRISVIPLFVFIIVCAKSKSVNQKTTPVLT